MDTKFKPPKAFFSYLVKEYSRRHYGHTGFKIEDYIQERLLSASYGLTAWIRSKEGVDWLFCLLGVDEVDAHDGFNYFFKPEEGPERPILNDKLLTIYRRVPSLTPDLPLSGIDIAKRVVFSEGWKLPSDDDIRFVFSTYRLWLKTVDGMDWVCSIFEPLKHMSLFDGRAYKYVAETGEKYWFDDNMIVTKPKHLEICINCEMALPCTDNYSGLGILCMRCYSEHFADEKLLKYCNRKECKNFGCSNYVNHETYEKVLSEIVQLPIRYMEA